MRSLLQLLGLAALTTAMPKSSQQQDDATAAASRFTYYDMPTALAGPCDVSTGPDGAIWVSDILIDKVARIDPKTGKVQEFDVPYSNKPEKGQLPPIPILPGLNRTAAACVSQPGLDGNMYFATGVRNQLVKLDMATKKFKVFTPPNFNPLGDLQPLNDMWRYKDGMYFTMTTAGKLCHFGYKSEKFTCYDVPGAEGIGKLTAVPVGVYWASDNGIWIAGFGAQFVARFDPESKTFRSYRVPANALGPAVTRVETEGRYVWYTGFLSNSLIRVEMATGAIKVFTTDVAGAFPVEDTVDGDGNLWYSTLTQNTINRLDPRTGKFSHFAQPGTLLPNPVSLPFPYADVASHWDRATNSIWFTEVARNRVGRFQL